MWGETDKERVILERQLTAKTFKRATQIRLKARIFPSIVTDLRQESRSQKTKSARKRALSENHIRETR
jgi:hypothetical protein